MRDALRGPVVEVSPRAAALLSPWMNGLREAMRRDGVVLDADVVSVLNGIKTLTAWHRDRVAREHEAARSSPLVVDPGELTPRQAAALVGITERAMRARCERGSANARKVSGRWLITIAD